MAEGDTLETQAQSEAETTIQSNLKHDHGSSNWRRPGQEWGTGFNSPAPGCWTNTVTRGKTTGAISLDVISP